MQKLKRRLAGLAIGGIVLSGALLSAAPAHATNINGLAGCSSIKGYTTNNQQYATRICNQISPGVVVRTVAKCGDGSTRATAWGSTSSSSPSRTVYCPTGWSVQSHWLEWYQS